MVNRFNFGFTPSGESRSVLVKRMKQQTADAHARGGRANTKLVSTRQGPATRALVRRNSMREGKQPRWASDSNPRFLSLGTTDAGYGAHRQYAGDSKFEGLMAAAQESQDRARANRPVGQTSANALALINSGDARVGRRVRTISGVSYGGQRRGINTQSMLALPAPTPQGITSIAATRALGYAPQIAPPAIMQLPFRGFDRNHPLDLT